MSALNQLFRWTIQPLQLLLTKGSTSSDDLATSGWTLQRGAQGPINLNHLNLLTHREETFYTLQTSSCLFLAGYLAWLYSPLGLACRLAWFSLLVKYRQSTSQQLSGLTMLQQLQHQRLSDQVV